MTENIQQRSPPRPEVRRSGRLTTVPSTHGPPATRGSPRRGRDRHSSPLKASLRRDQREHEDGCRYVVVVVGGGVVVVVSCLLNVTSRDGTHNTQHRPAPNGSDDL